VAPRLEATCPSCGTPVIPSKKFCRSCGAALPAEPAGRFHRLLEACCQHRCARLADLVKFCLYTGLRQGEALTLSGDRVDRARGVVLLDVTKSGRRREVPLCGPADAALARLQATGGTGPVFVAARWTAFRKAWERALPVAGLDALHFHDLRHTFASRAVQRGATLQEVKDLLGHSTLAMVMRYAHLSPEHLRSAVSRLDDVMMEGRSRANEIEQDREAAVSS
jgi:integrase